MQCAVCNEFLGRGDYSCQECNYSVHAKCFTRVITKCINSHSEEYAKLSKEEQNTGQLLKYNIPHRWESSINMGASWCGHCGHLVPPAKKVHKCSECSKISHKTCSAMIPNFCGLAPIVADQLVSGLEEIEEKLRIKELQDAEDARKHVKDEAETHDTMGQVDFKALERIETEKTNLLSKAPTLKKQSRNAIAIEDFEMISVLGRGAFGKVMLVSDKCTGVYLAMKALKKEFLVQNDDIER